MYGINTFVPAMDCVMQSVFTVFQMNPDGNIAIVLVVQAQRRSKEHSRSTSALSGLADEKSEVSQDADHHLSLYSNGFMASSIGKAYTVYHTNTPQHML